MINGLIIRLAAMTVQRALIIGVILGGIFYATMFDDGSGIEKQIAEIQTQITTEEGVKTETEQAVREAEQVRANVAALSEQFKTVSNKIPLEVSMADIIKDVDNVSRASGVSIKSKEPMPVISKDFFEEIPLKISLEGSYSEITMFLYYVSAMERIMRIKQFSISEPSEFSRTTGSSNSFKLFFEGEITAYRFIGEKKP